MFFRQLLANLGVQFQHGSYGDEKAISDDGSLVNALVLAPVKGETDILKGIDEHKFFAGAQAGGIMWRNVTAQDGRIEISNPVKNAAGYVSFWLYSPRSLSNLLLEPDMPRLDLHINTNDDYQVFLNRKQIGTSADKHETIKALPLEKGWNHFFNKVYP